MTTNAGAQAGLNQQPPSPLWVQAFFWFRLAAKNGDADAVLKAFAEQCSQIFQAKYQAHLEGLGLHEAKGLTQEEIFINRTVENWARLKVVDPKEYAAQSAKWAEMLQKRYASATAGRLVDQIPDSMPPVNEQA